MKFVPFKRYLLGYASIKEQSTLKMDFIMVWFAVSLPHGFKDYADSQIILWSSESLQVLGPWTAGRIESVLGLVRAASLCHLFMGNKRFYV